MNLKQHAEFPALQSSSRAKSGSEAEAKIDWSRRVPPKQDSKTTDYALFLTARLDEPAKAGV